MKKKTPKRRKTPKRSVKGPFVRYEISMGITQSILKDFLDCRERAHQKREGWEPTRKKTSFRFGSLVHNALEFAYKGIREGIFKAGSAFTKKLKQKIVELVDVNMEGASLTESIDEMEREGQMACALLEEYFKFWSKDWTREWVAVEGQFDTQFTPFGPSKGFYNPPGGGGRAFEYRLRGMRDGVFLDRPKRGDRGIWALETKTKSRISEDDLDLTLAFDFQSLYYLLALELEGVTHSVRGCLYNIIRKPGLKRLKAGKNRKKEETEAQFMDRIRADIKKRPDHYFKRYEIVFPKETREEFRKELGVQLNEFRLWLNGERPTYKNPSACVTQYKCEFLEKCSSGGFVGYSQTRTPFPELENGSPEVKLMTKRRPMKKENHDGRKKSRTPKRKAIRRREKVGLR